MNSGTSQWRQMLNIVTQDKTLLQCNLIYSFKKLFFIRLLSENILIFLLQYTGLMFSTLNAHPSLIWFATSTACGFIFMRGLTILPGIFLGSFLAYGLSGFTFGYASAYAILFSLQAFLLLKICYRLVIPTLIFYDKKLFLKFVLCSGILTAIVSIFLTSLFYLSHHIIKPFLHMWAYFWLTNFNAILILSCALITWDSYFAEIFRLKNMNKYLLVILYSTMFFLTLSLLFNLPSEFTILIFLLLFTNILYMSSLYGWCGAICVASLLGFTIHFEIYMTAFTLHKIILLELYVSITTITGLFIAIQDHSPEIVIP